jgi:hypothetical protein
VFSRKEIVEFASTGPKNYTFKLDTGITHTKINGFSLNIAALIFKKLKKLSLQKRK